jgi:hypothetical protein
MVGAPSGYNSHLAFETARPSQAREATSTISNLIMDVFGGAFVEQPHNTVNDFCKMPVIFEDLISRFSLTRLPLPTGGFIWFDLV